MPAPAAASAEPAAAAGRRCNRELAALMASAAVVGASLSLSFPLLSLVLEARGASSSAIGLNAAAHGLGVLLAAPLFGTIIQRLGAARTMRAGLALAAMTLAVFPLHLDLGWWFALRLVFGAATGMVFIVSEAAINALVEDARRGRVLGLYGTMFAIGYAAGPLVLGAIGSQGPAPFAVGATVLALGILPTFALPSIDTALAGGAGAYALRRLAGLWRVAPLILAVALVVAVVETSQFALLPIWGLRHGLGESAAALLLSVWIGGNILLQYPVGWLADRWPRHGLLAACAALAALLSLLLLSPAVIALPALLWPILVVHGGMSGALYVLALTLMGERFKGAALAAANATFIVSFELGVMTGPIVAGSTMTLLGPQGLPVVLAVAFAAMVPPALAARRREPARP